MPIITAILIPAADCVHLLHQLVNRPVTAQFIVMVLKSRIILHALYNLFRKLGVP